MTPPEAPEDTTGNPPPAVSVCLKTMRKRADFLAAARGPRLAKPGFVVQARNRKDGEATIRVGFTASKKVGNAVARNRAKRRLRAVAREVLVHKGRPGWDYVLIARRDTTASLKFTELLADLGEALSKLHNRA